MKKYRILLYSMTFFRDFSGVYILSKLLERLGFDCFIACTENYLTSWIRWFKPHAVFFVTPTQAQRLINHFPGASLFYCGGEGEVYKDDFPEKTLIDDLEILKKIDKIFLWGRNPLQTMGTYIDSSPKFNENRSEIKNLVKKKVMVTGHPRLDLIRFCKTRNEIRKKVRIGFIGNFTLINSIIEKNHPLTLLINGKQKAQFDAIVYAYKVMDIYLQIINSLSKDDYSFSLRPYPLENRDRYNESVLVKNKVLEIDDSHEFCSWLSKQDIVVTDFTSTLSQIVFSGKRLINICNLAQRPEELVHPISIEFKKNLEEYCPNNMDELMDMIRYYDKPITYSEYFLDYLDELYNSSAKMPAVVQMAREIYQTVSAKVQTKRYGLSAKSLMRINRAYLYLRKRRHRDTTSYSLIPYHKIESSIAPELHPIYEDILEHSDKN